MIRQSRRDLLKTGAVAGTSLFVSEWLRPTPVVAANLREKLPVAAIVTEYRKASHADVIVGKILEGYRQDGGAGPDLKIVSLYADQFPANDLSRGLADKHGFRLTPSIDEAITLGTNQVQVAGVLSIGEHGNYPMTPDTKQHMYPRRRFFDEIVATFRRCGQSVPIFNDKHLSYRWSDAKYMVETAQTMKFPFIAGSSLPLGWRLPLVDLPMDCEIEAALALGYGGLEAYGYHALETLQCMIERRRGGETGVSSVQAVTGDGIRTAEKQGRWSRDLFEAALATLPGFIKSSDEWMSKSDAAAYLMQHRDGLKSAVIMANGLSTEFAFAAKLKGRAEPIATWFKLQPGPPYSHFAYLVQAIEHTIHTGNAAYPVERTLLTTGVLDRIMQSMSQDRKLFETPELDVRYKAVDWPFANHPNATMSLPSD